MGRDRLPHGRGAREHVVGAGPERHAVVAAGVVGGEVDVLAVRRVALDERHLVRGRARIHERAPHHRRERPVCESCAADISDRLWILRMENDRKPRGEALDQDLEDHVRLREAIVRARERDVVDLHEEGPLVRRAELERLPVQRPAVFARRIRRERRFESGCRRGGLRPGRCTGGGRG